MSQAALRPAQSTDAVSMAELHARCFDLHWDANAFSGFLARESCCALLARRPGADRAEAFILLQIAGGECEILTLATAPHARRAGLARALVRAGAEEAARRGASKIHLEVAGDNDAARALYDVEGFAVGGRRRGYYVRAAGPSADALILSAMLPLAGR